MSKLFKDISKEVITALKAGDKIKTGTLRFLLAAIKSYEIDAYPPGSTTSLTDEEVIKVIQKQVKTHKESIAAYAKGNRADLKLKEEAELAILSTYLPPQLTAAQIREIVHNVTASGMTTFGQVMGVVMKELKGKADGAQVKQIVQEELK